jgi:folate-binding protein YgfZ
MNSPWTSLLPTPLPSEVDFSRASTLIPLPSLGVIRLEGPDSLKFLQGQTTTDFREVEKGRVLPGAICSLKGRVLFSFIAVPDGENVALILPTDQVEAALAHLGKFAVFSKIRLQDASASIALLGVAGPDTEQLLLELEIGGASADAQTPAPADYQLARMLTDGRCIVMLGVDMLRQRWPALREKASVASENVWWAADIRSGFATVFAGTRDLFQPQELNYHVLEAVSYNKGCYTGQEVVARLYFRGKLKQRLYRLQADAAVTGEGHGIFLNGEQVGGIVMSASERPDTTAILAVVKNTAARDGGLTLGAGGTPLKVMPLPYELPAEKEE